MVLGSDREFRFQLERPSDTATAAIQRINKASSSPFSYCQPRRLPGDLPQFVDNIKNALEEPLEMPNLPTTSSLQIQPGDALGPLSLSGSVYATLTSLLLHKSTFPRLNISFNSTDPVSNPIYIDLEANGLRLRFDGESQRLELIEVTEFGKIGLLYSDSNLRYILSFEVLIKSSWRPVVSFHI